ncbi:hypothetical protein [Stenotrophomonas maltophilia]|uniref:hypothetical protein n=1 Tax=Stenotrophomonas maltophilia TaxID=40324 RepID=UPI00073964B0|nr:hypothetical protein [Stenotrophomonas maltophilia]CRD59173.1 hypothetical protein BN1263390081 [Stenotrophomonas maltophilia]
MPHLPSGVCRRTLSALAKIGDISEVSNLSVQSLDRDEILSGSFSFLELALNGMQLLLACSRGGYKLDWIVAKHLAESTSGLYDIVVVSAESLLAPERLALSSVGLSYIAIDREIFIPTIGANTCSRPLISQPTEKLSIATQAVLTHALNSCKCRYEISKVLSELAIPPKRLGSVSHELVLAGIGAVDRIGAKSNVEMDECSVTWARIEPALTSPIIDVLRIRSPDLTRLGQMRLSGEDALHWRERSEFKPPRRFAMHERLLRSVGRRLSLNEVDSVTELEIWNRCPARLSPRTTHVDPISLYLCRRDQATPAELSLLRKMISERW